MPMYNLIEYSGNYSKTGGLLQYYSDEPTFTNADVVANFSDTNNSASFKFKQKITSKTADGGTKNVEIMSSLKYLSNFWRILEMPLTNCEVNLIFTWSKKCVLSNTDIWYKTLCSSCNFYQLKIIQNCYNN